MSEQRFLWAVARQVAEEIIYALTPCCARIEIAGSLRRKKPDVGDIEILHIPRFDDIPAPGNLFCQPINLADKIILDLEANGILERRLNSRGREAFGPLNKLMRHVASGIPVDLFATTEECWYNALVCRTGPADLNKQIAAAAIAKGWHWNVYGPGFSRPAGNTRETEAHLVISERDVFEFVGLPYLEPEQRK